MSKARWKRFRIQVRSKDSQSERGWSVPGLSPTDSMSADLHFDGEDAALAECEQPIYGAKNFWCSLRIWDAKEHRVVAEWCDGERITSKAKDGGPRE